MGYHYDIFSSYTTKIVAVTMLLMALGEYSPVSGDCDATALPTYGECYGNYGNCVINVITALRAATPNTDNYIKSWSYPREGARGGVIGDATCVHANGLTACQDCLVAAHKYLSACGSTATGSYGSDECTMNFRPIP
ncbi:hypothetical protein LINGRAHAP2_LOCUS34021 [Linum grandiflorum]